MPLLPSFATALALAVSDPGLPRGQVVEHVVCREKPEQSYALYLPSAYIDAKAWPVLYMLDARGRALVPIERFRRAAEEYGWILVSSYNTRSDTKGDPNTPAASAMWNDSHARLTLDDRRAYLTGFSGGGRASVYLALHAPDRIAGVIGCGAGFADEATPVKNLPFPYFGTVGTRDFNYYEMRDLDERLADAKAAHRIEVFDGGHDWPPAPLARESVAWMELQAIRKGVRASDAGLVAALYAQDLARARELAAQGRHADAFVRYGRVAEDFRGLTDTSAAATEAAALGKSGAAHKALREARRRDQRDQAAIGALSQKLRRALNATELPLAGIVTAELGIPALRKKAASADAPEERLSAERVLSNLRVQTSYYLPEQFLDDKDYSRARLVLSVAAEIDPDDPIAYYNLASAHARSGEMSRALKDLQRSVDKGFRRFDLLDTDPDFDSLRTEPAFQKWLATTRDRVPAPSPTP